MVPVPELVKDQEYFKAIIRKISSDGYVTIMFMKKFENFDLKLINKDNLNLTINNPKVNFTDWAVVSFNQKYLIIKLKIQNTVQVS